MTFSANEKTFTGKVVKATAKSAIILFPKRTSFSGLKKGTAVTFVTDEGASEETGEDEGDDDEGHSTGDLSTSRLVRPAKPIGVAPTIGLMNSGFTGLGLRGIYAISEKLEASALFLTATNDTLLDFEEPDLKSTGSASVSLFVTEARYFFGNSFYLGAGLGYLSFDINAKADFFLDDVIVEFAGEASSFLIDFSIGNQWSFASGFFIDAAWLTFSQPLTSSASSTLSISGGGTLGTDLQDDIDDLNDDLTTTLKEDLAGSSFISLFYVGLGYRF